MAEATTSRYESNYIKIAYPKSIPTLALFGAKDRSVKKFIRIHQLETMPSTAPLHIQTGLGKTNIITYLFQGTINSLRLCAFFFLAHLAIGHVSFCHG
jgi:hypothetical protein